MSGSQFRAPSPLDLKFKAVGDCLDEQTQAVEKMKTAVEGVRADIEGFDKRIASIERQMRAVLDLLERILG